MDWSSSNALAPIPPTLSTPTRLCPLIRCESGGLEERRREGEREEKEKEKEKEEKEQLECLFLHSLLGD